jgi:16S rRNA (adenine1518-N6/adenine1519-N6)-dimethyltransferase
LKHNPRKRFGQNFLSSQPIIHQIIQAIHPLKNDNMLEIGPGMGALTKPLLNAVDKLNAIEIDRDLYEYLGHLESAKNKLHLISADALSIDYSRFGQHLRVVGNLPYNISTPLLIHLLQYTSFIDDMHFMLQKEVVERMAAVPGTKDYGRLSVILQFHCEVEHLFDVAPEAFEPKPKVVSAVVRLTPYLTSPYEQVDWKSLEQIVAKAFAMRRKTLINNLKGLVSASQLQDLGIDGARRPEQISVSEYVQLAKFISN